MSFGNAETPVNSQYVRYNIVPLSKLPKPGVRFENTDVPDEIDLRALIVKSIIKPVDTKKRHYENDGTDHYRTVKVWETTDRGYELIQRYLDAEFSNRLPCSGDAPHTGFINCGDDEFECKQCGAVHGRDTIKQVFGGGA